MTPTRTPDPAVVDEDVKIFRWRRDYLKKLGCSGVVAGELALDTSVSPHEVENLTRRGCPPDTAARIAAS